ncbi:VWA domain-containing protein [Amycolatopsis acidicola]|uniref:VWA domain-containing protein n=1 Tax=Amycolatopsis acidicola TaxID=2596893 RepID=A0A5N0V375_9PSEU|nr:VWA domain-containing protein [Amycolatopsis acidicola]KAA9160907.1 VWA domain-containing protein [Amycolatopsis acidicola]
MSRFSLELDQNKYLSSSDTHVHAVLTVCAEDTSVPGTTPPAGAEVLLIDCSSSMGWPPTKIAAARRAAAAAIDVLPEGTRFAVVEGTGAARMCYPATETLVVADENTRAEAKAAANRLIASGGTAMSTWLSLAGRLFEAHPDTVRHALLLTDGRNESESPVRLSGVLGEVEGRFTCDARGIGDDWEPEELRRIAAALRGTADAVVDESRLAEHFRELIGSSVARTVPDLRLRIGVAPHARISFLRQVAPVETELVKDADHGIELSTGAWGDECREYHLCLEVDLADLPHDQDQELGWVELVPVTQDTRVPAGPARLLGHITGDLALSAPLHEKVEHYTVQGELGQRLRAGWARFRANDRDGAAAEWGEAARLAVRLGNDEVLARLRRIADIEDAAASRLRIKDEVQPRNAMSVALTNPSSELSDVDREPAGNTVAEGDPLACPNCSLLSPAGAAVCMHCGHRFAEPSR